MAADLHRPVATKEAPNAGRPNRCSLAVAVVVVAASLAWALAEAAEVRAGQAATRKALLEPEASRLWAAEAAREQLHPWAEVAAAWEAQRLEAAEVAPSQWPSLSASGVELEVPQKRSQKNPSPPNP